MTGNKQVTASRAFLLLALPAMAALPLAGCDSFNRAIGRTRVIPDEFQVVSNAPLAIPPDYALRPPRIGAGANDQSAAEQQAKESVFRAGEQQAALPTPQAARSAGEDDILRETGAASAPADIRKLVDTDPKQGVPFERSLVDKLVFWEGPKTPPANDVINPSEESSRIRLAQSVAKPDSATPPPSNGAGTPTFERTSKKSSWFDWLF